MVTDVNQSYCGDHFTVYLIYKYQIITCQLFLSKNNNKVRSKFEGKVRRFPSCRLFIYRGFLYVPGLSHSQELLLSRVAYFVTFELT